MCGICGIVNSNLKQHSDINTLEEMRETLIHRGPDDEGIYEDDKVGFAFRRLSIIDLKTGHQPLHNENKNIWAMCNGEIYNFVDLRQDLQEKGHQFCTNSDCEVILHLYEEYGDDFIQKLNGMFALSLWDKKDKKLILARDRMGQKPLYYAYINNKLIFASEIKAILKHSDIKKELDYNSLNKYLTFEYIPAPNSIFKGIKKLLPAQMLILKKGELKFYNYWQMKPSIYKKISINRVALEIKGELIKSVERRLISDVPLGAFLSGGIDSSIIVALMTKMSSNKVKTFNIGFEEKSFDESLYAEKIAEKFNTEHHFQILKAKDMLNLIPQITSFLDEPLADASIIPTYLLSKFTRNYVKVALSGDGGDELFAGYPTYNAHKIAKFYQFVPKLLRDNLINRMINKMPVSTDDISLDFKLKKFISGIDYPPLIRHYLWLGSFLPAEKENLLTRQVKNELKDTNEFEEIDMYLQSFDSQNLLEKILYLDSKFYLQDDILTKVDRASMATSLEVRSPFLDYEFVDYVSSLPVNLKLRRNINKYVFKMIAKDMLPKDIINRPKKGFGIPLAKWFKNELKDFVQNLLNPVKIKKQGYFNPDYIQLILNQHLEGKKDNRKLIWTLLIFQMWYEKYNK